MLLNSSDWVGARLGGGRYEVKGLLGEGGMGFVYRALDRNVGTEVVIKAPRADDVGSAEFAGRFLDEIRSLVRLAHLHIVRIIDVGEHNGVPFAVMPFLSAGSLEDRRQRDGDRLALPPESLRDWLPAIAGALDFVHDQGYVHRDVKPANILFDSHGFAYLSDFGVVKGLASLAAGTDRRYMTVCGAVMGTPIFMAPELIAGEEINGTIDQYALAVSVYLAITGRPPVDGSNAASILLKRMGSPVPSPDEIRPGLPRGLCKAVLRGLEKDRTQRFPDCASFASAVMEGIRSTDAPGPKRQAEERTLFANLAATATPRSVLDQAKSLAPNWKAAVESVNDESIRLRVELDRSLLRRFLGGRSSVTAEITAKPSADADRCRVRVDLNARGNGVEGSWLAEKAREFLAQVRHDLELSSVVPEPAPVPAPKRSETSSARPASATGNTSGGRSAETTVIVTIAGADAAETPEELVCTVSRASPRGLYVLSPRPIGNQDVVVRVGHNTPSRSARAVFSMAKGDNLHQVSLVLESELPGLPEELLTASLSATRSISLREINRTSLN